MEILKCKETIMIFFINDTVYAISGIYIKHLPTSVYIKINVCSTYLMYKPSMA